VVVSSSHVKLLVYHELGQSKAFESSVLHLEFACSAHAHNL